MNEVWNEENYEETCKEKFKTQKQKPKTSEKIMAINPIKEIDLAAMRQTGINMIQVGTLYLNLVKLATFDGENLEKELFEEIMRNIHKQIMSFQQDFFLVRDNEKTMYCIGQKVVDVINHFQEYRDIYDVMGFDYDAENDHDTNE